MIEHLLNHLVTRWLERRLEKDALDLHAEPTAGAFWRLTYSRFYKVFWSAQALFWGIVGGLFVWGYTTGELDWRFLLAAAVFAAIFLFSAFAAWDGYTQAIEVTVSGITELRRGVLVTFLPWTALRRVRFVAIADSYHLTPEGGLAIRFSKHIQGLPRFKWLCLKYAPAHAIDPIRARLADLSRL